MVFPSAISAPNFLKGTNEPELKFKEVLNESVTLTAAEGLTKEVVVADKGDPVGILVNMTVTVSGTLSAQQPISKGIKRLILLDKANKSMADNVGGFEFNQFQYRAGDAGKKETDPNVSNSAQTISFVVPWPIDKRDLPAKLQFVIPIMTELATGATGGSVVIRAKVLYRDGSTARTFRVQKKTVAYISGDNSYTFQLPQGKLVCGFDVRITEADLVSVTFRKDGGEQLETILKQDLIDMIESRRVDAHITNFIPIPLDPFVVNAGTELIVNANTSGSLDLIMYLADDEPAK